MVLLGFPGFGFQWEVVRSILVDVHDGLSKVTWSFLRKIVPYSASRDPMHIFAGELIGTSTGVQRRWRW
jgi:hypothetical protein